MKKEKHFTRLKISILFLLFSISAIGQKPYHDWANFKPQDNAPSHRVGRLYLSAADTTLYVSDGLQWISLLASTSGSTTLDQTPTSGNTANALSSAGAFNALNLKQDAATAYDGSDALKLSGANQTVDKRVKSILNLMVGIN